MLGSLSTKSSDAKQKKKKTVNSLGMFKIDSPEESVDSLDFFKPKAILKAAGEQAAPQGNWAETWLGLGKKDQAQGTEMQPGVSYSPAQMAEAQKAQEQQAQAPEAQKEAAIQYSREVIHAGESKREEQESGQKIQMLIQELQRLATSVAQIEKAMILQAIDPSAAQKTGKYYESFFEWMLMVVQDARRKVEDSGAWLSAMSSKKKPGIHAVMKTNMKVAMSGERTNANNTG